MNIINFEVPETGSFLVDIILWLVKITSSVAWGVVLFTVLLKLITFPFDYISRASTRKNSIKMEEMRPELEKLQKQYADNKELYNRKMAALYKKNGYSMWGACLPSILTLVVFFVAIEGFNSYSRFRNKKYFYDMSVAYNSVVYDGLECDDTYIIRKDNSIYIDMEKINAKLGENTSFEVEGKDYSIFVEQNGEQKHIYTTNSYVTCIYTNENSMDFISREAGLDNNTTLKVNGKTYSEFKETDKVEDRLNDSDKALSLVDYFIKEARREASATTYRENKSSFLWVKNIWVADKATAHPIETLTEFNNKYGEKVGGGCACGCGGTMEEAISEANYNELTFKLTEEKTSANGYYILVILTAGVSLLSQVIISKSQKAQMELQTVNGQGAQTQKTMTIMMPIMMAIFAFMYTAAFSIYIILSSAITLLTTVVTNKIIDKKYKSNTTAPKVTHSRVYVPKEEPKKEEPKKKSFFSKKEEEKKGDFLSGEADKKKHYRGRIK